MREPDLLAAIAADPTDPGPRRRLINGWSHRPHADLIRLLVYLPAGESEGLIKDWFANHEGWPRRFPERPARRGADLPCRCDAPSSLVVEPWLYYASDPGHWPDRARWHAGVVALARRRLLNAREAFPPDHPTRMALEAIVAAPPAEPSRPSPAELAGEHAATHVRSHHQRDHGPALRAIREGQTVAALIYDDIGTDPGAGAIDEFYEQFHVLGWAWLGLPPLRPEAPSELRPPPKKLAAPDPDDWPDATITPDRGPGPWWRRPFG